MKVGQVADFLTVRAAAEALGVQYYTLCKRIQRWGIPVTQAGRTYLIRRADLARCTARGR